MPHWNKLAATVLLLTSACTKPLVVHPAEPVLPPCIVVPDRLLQALAADAHRQDPQRGQRARRDGGVHLLAQLRVPAR